MFPTTVWTTIREAAGRDDAARERFALLYREPVVRWLRRRGFQAQDADDLCQEVFVRIFQHSVLERAEPERGRFRGLLLTMTRRVVLDRLRKRRESQLPDTAAAGLESEPDGDDSAFDGEWALTLVQRAVATLRAESPGYAGVLESHLKGGEVDRQKLWIARRKLAALVRREVALTCASPRDIEAEMAHLAPLLQPRAENP